MNKQVSKRKTIEINCDRCGVVFLSEKRRINYRIKHGFKNVCSRLCDQKHRKLNRLKNCKFCNKEFLAPVKKIEFCSRTCANQIPRYRNVEKASIGMKKAWADGKFDNMPFFINPKRCLYCDNIFYYHRNYYHNINIF